MKDFSGKLKHESEYTYKGYKQITYWVSVLENSNFPGRGGEVTNWVQTRKEKFDVAVGGRRKKGLDLSNSQTSNRLSQISQQICSILTFNPNNYRKKLTACPLFVLSEKSAPEPEKNIVLSQPLLRSVKIWRSKKVAILMKKTFS